MRNNPQINYESENKEIYRLWWEYLKRSERYTEFIEWWNRKGDTPLPEPLKEFHDSFWHTYLNFGNVHSNNFDEWWKDQLDTPHLPSPYKPYFSATGKNIVDYRDNIGRDIRIVNRKFKKEIGREPTWKELSLNIRNYMDYWVGERMYILIEFQHASTEQVVKEFRKFLSDRKKDPEVKKTTQMIKGKNNKPTIHKSCCEEIQRYLAVYDLHKEGLTIPQIVKRLWIPPDKEDLKRLNITGDHYDDKDVQRSFRRDLQKAKKIISNVEYGFFPGNYLSEQLRGIEDS